MAISGSQTAGGDTDTEQLKGDAKGPLEGERKRRDEEEGREAVKTGVFFVDPCTVVGQTLFALPRTADTHTHTETHALMNAHARAHTGAAAAIKQGGS